MLPLKGVADTQESVMLLAMDKRLTNFSVAEANKLRKTIAKKISRDIDSMKDFFFTKGKENNCSFSVLNYLWSVQFARQLGYSFSAPHVIAYSTIAIQEMNIAYHYPTVFWNCACLIVDSAGTEETEWDLDLDEDNLDLITEDDEDIVQFELFGESNDGKKKKQRNINYGKISTAISRMMSRGIKVELPDINKSEYTFTPDVEHNRILFGIKGIARINESIARDIISNRPYESLTDFQKKVKVNKIPMVNLIKSGAFDTLENKSREEIMHNYFISIADQKKRLTLQNMQMLIKYDLLSKDFDFEKKIFNFTKYLRKFKMGDNFELDDRALAFYTENFDVDLLKNINGRFFINQKEWKKIYDKQMKVIRALLKDNHRLLQELNLTLLNEVAEKYSKGNISKWEMDSVNFYYHEHELVNVDYDYYEIRDFHSEPENPVVARTFQKDGRTIPLFELWRIVGTVIDKNKLKNLIVLSTPTGVVEVKVYRAQFSKYDKQLSEKQPDGTKKIVEKSWFARGNKLMLTGIRRDNTFVPKVYKNSPFQYPIQLIEEVKDNGKLVFREMRG